MVKKRILSLLSMSLIASIPLQGMSAGLRFLTHPTVYENSTEVALTECAYIGTQTMLDSYCPTGSALLKGTVIVPATIAASYMGTYYLGAKLFAKAQTVSIKKDATLAELQEALLNCKSIQEHTQWSYYWVHKTAVDELAKALYSKMLAMQPKAA